MTVAQWYQKYSAPEYRDSYIVVPKNTQRNKSKANAKPYAFSVELYINVGQVSQGSCVLGFFTKSIDADAVYGSY